MCSMPADRPFVDRPPGDTAAATWLAARTAAELGLPPPTLMNLGMNAVFGAGEVVLRVGRPTADASSAYDLADALTAAGVRVVRPAAGRIVVVDSDDETGQPLVATTWELLRSTGTDADWAAVGHMVRTLHELAPSAVPSSYPTPSCTTFPWWQFEQLLGDIEPDVDDPAFRALVDTVDRHRGWVEQSGGPARWVLCHGDVHPANVIATAAGPVVIDWDLLATGPPGWDHAPLLSMIRHWGYPPEFYEHFARGYGTDLSAEPVTIALTELRAAAATIMRVIAGRNDPDARLEAERRLRYWRGDPGAPTWTMS